MIVLLLRLRANALEAYQLTRLTRSLVRPLFVLMVALTSVLSILSLAALSLANARSFSSFSGGLGAAERGARAADKVLILYDRADDEAASDQAGMYALMLEHLLGHFDGLAVETRPAPSYEPGDAFDTLRTFYIGSVYDAEVPEALTEDILKQAPVTWMDYNIWTLGASAQNALGFDYVTLHRAATPPSFTRSFNRVRYRNFTFNKYPAPMEMVELRARRSARVHAWALNANNRRIPYIIQRKNFWYVADNPFTYMHETDRYLVFADVLGLMLERQETCEPKAILRFEDVSPMSDPAALATAFAVVKDLGVPAAAAVVPRFIDASGAPISEKTWAEVPGTVALLQEFEASGGKIFQHGYTHQYETFKNPSGRSLVDWEFWDVEANAPIQGLSAREARERVARGKALLERLALRPVGWVTPHYQADPSLYESFNGVYGVSFERRQYRVGELVASQFFPYLVHDGSGGVILPENAGFVEDAASFARIVERARANRALTCPRLGLFFHPSLFTRSANGKPAVTVEAFENFIADIRALGYRFVDPLTLED